MMNAIDSVLNRITMYRLTLYYLIFLLGTAVILAFTGLLNLDPYALLFSTAFLLAVCAFTNWLFAKAFSVPANTESVYISALILALIIAPLQEYHDLWFLGWAAVWAMASKYIIAINRKHLFNPVAFAVLLTYFTIDQSANWWVGNAYMLPFVLLGGFLIVRKIRRFDLVLSFLLTALATTTLVSLFTGDNPLTALQSTVVYSPLFFFAFIILTEPLTTPPTARLRMIYGGLVGILFSPQFHLGSFYLTPEMAIVAGNLFSYLVSPKAKLMLTLKKKIEIAPNIFDFIFEPSRRLAFAPGQYMEWTLAHNEPDSRGNRRYFTLASSPTENELRIGVKFYEQSSTFKQAMLAMNQDSQIMAGQLAGDFVLLNDPYQKCVFIAGGIGITPFRSMLQYLLDHHETRPIVLYYVNRRADEIVYTDVLNRALRELRIRTIYTLTDPDNVPAWWRWRVGHLTPQTLAEDVPDYRNCIFYISGPNAMVNTYKRLLHQLDVPDSQIKTDFFPGFA